MTNPTACPACYAPLAPEARYCHRCGRAVTAGGLAERTPWFIAWAVVGLCVAGIVYFVTHKPDDQARPDMANAGAAGGAAAGESPPAGGAGQPPDISQMTPRERFTRLSGRIMTAAGQGDTAMVQRFSPMALSAYSMLDSIDADMRFRVAEVYVQLGHFPAALALADTIQTGAPHHLFADLLRAEVAERKKDAAGFDRNRKNFLAHYDAELAAHRPEYAAQQAALDAFKAQSGPK